MEKIKGFFQSEQWKDILTVAVVIFVGFGSFILGRMSVENNQTTSAISDTNENQNADVVSSIPDVGIPQGESPTSGDSENSSNKNFFASSKGKKYYTANCSAGKNIKTSNLVYFDTASQAESAGYTLSSSCK